MSHDAPGRKALIGPRRAGRGVVLLLLDAASRHTRQTSLPSAGRYMMSTNSRGRRAFGGGGDADGGVARRCCEGGLTSASAAATAGGELDVALEEDDSDFTSKQLECPPSESEESDSEPDSRSMSHSPRWAGGCVSRSVVTVVSPLAGTASEARSGEVPTRRFFDGRESMSQRTVRLKSVLSSGSGVWLGLRLAASTKGLIRRGGGDWVGSCGGDTGDGGYIKSGVSASSFSTSPRVRFRRSSRTRTLSSATSRSRASRTQVLRICAA
ncbi:hypothetical protein C8R47DRAFT_1102048 [Mycena vitilis]|nr:hypothetical protein C8R47DRAFT_1102048 [Mycena vitilis]